MNRRIVSFYADNYPVSPGGYGDLAIPAGLSSELDHWDVTSHTVTGLPEGGLLVTMYCVPKA